MPEYAAQCHGAITGVERVGIIADRCCGGVGLRKRYETRVKSGSRLPAVTSDVSASSAKMKISLPQTLTMCPMSLLSMIGYQVSRLRRG